jgi:hypothetical protein
VRLFLQTHGDLDCGQQSKRIEGDCRRLLAMIGDPSGIVGEINFAGFPSTGVSR